MNITEVCVPVKEIHARAKAAGVSITVFLTAALIWAIHEEVPQNQAKKPIGLMIPVNLRNYFPSRSMANFFGWIEISCYFQPDTAFEDILRSVKEQFAKELSKDVIEAKLNDLVSLEKIRSCVWYHWRSNPVPSCRDDSRREVYHGDLFQCGDYPDAGGISEIYSEIRTFCKHGQSAAVFLFFWR